MKTAGKRRVEVKSSPPSAAAITRPKPAPIRDCAAPTSNPAASRKTESPFRGSSPKNKKPGLLKIEKARKRSKRSGTAFYWMRSSACVAQVNKGVGTRLSSTTAAAATTAVRVTHRSTDTTGSPVRMYITTTTRR